MAKGLKITAVLSLTLTAIFTIIYIATSNGLALTLLITAGTTSYHFCMRLIVGVAINLTLKNRVNYNRRWFKVSKKEQKLYQKLGVKNWKGQMPTYSPDTFDPQKHTWEEILMATCQAEIVHEIIILLSFVPIFFANWLDAFWVFLLTSILSSCVDFVFVIMQRYNRPRVLKLVNKVAKQHA